MVTRWKNFLLGFVVGLILVMGVVYREKIIDLFQNKKTVPETINVTIPTIIDGELVLPKVATPAPTVAPKSGLGVVSANIIGIFSEEKLSGIRIVGETLAYGEKTVEQFSSVVKFLDKDGKTLAQKIAHLTSGFEFFGLRSGEKTYYDVTVDNPPTADRLEVTLNPIYAEKELELSNLKVASSSVETKFADYSSGASGSASQKVAYYLVSGAIENSLSDPVVDVTIYSWAKDKDGKVFTFARQDFKNDLLPAGEKIDFKLILLPMKIDAKFASFETAVWGKRYKIGG